MPDPAVGAERPDSAAILAACDAGHGEGWYPGTEPHHDGLPLVDPDLVRALVADRDALQERAELCALCTPERDHNGVLCRACANRKFDSARREREQAVDALTAIRYGRVSQRGQHNLSAADCANFAASVLDALAAGESKP